MAEKVKVSDTRMLSIVGKAGPIKKIGNSNKNSFYSKAKLKAQFLIVSKLLICC
jgi:hypothetical protein